MNSNNQFERFISLVGEDAFKRVLGSHVLVVGLGGVGGFTVESLVRCGIGEITIVDYDTVDITNLNRQIIALHSTIGKKKIDVLEQRIKDINPNCIVHKFDMFLDKDNIDDLFNVKYDFIIDCCDSMNTKRLLIDKTINTETEHIASMGTANKMDPTKFEIVDIRKTESDPVARILRKYIRDKKIKKKIMVLSSKEVPKKNKNVLASSAFTPSVAGLIISSYVIKKIINK